MDCQVCEKLVPYGIHLYQSLFDADVSPVVHVLSGQETDEVMQGYFREAGFAHMQETVVMGIALNGSEKQVVLIRAAAMHSTFQFLQTLWHEMGHFSFRKNNPGLFFDLMSDPARLWFCPMMQGIVLKFWDEAIAQCTSNRVIRTLPSESLESLCPDAQQQIAAERNFMQYFLNRCLKQGRIDFDLPLMNLLNIPFSPYCLAIYCAEAATSPWDDGCQCQEDTCGTDRVAQCVLDLVELVRVQYQSEAPLVVTEELLHRTAGCFVRLSESLGADGNAIQWMQLSLADVMAKIQK